MDAFHRYTRPPPPPPPSAGDPHYHQYQQQPPPGAPPVPPSQAPWYANQFQYNASNSQSPSPPPPPPPWPQPPPQSNHLNPPMLASAYPPPPPPPHYPGYQPPPAHGQFPPRPFPPPPTQHLNSYPPQEWNNSNWTQQQNWNHPAHSDSEDWAARAKAWATAKASMENQPQQGHYTPSGRQEEQNRYQIPYAQAETQYTENHQRSPMMSGYQQHPVSTPHLPGQPTHFQEHASTSAGSSSYGPDGSLTYSATDGASNGDQNAAFHPEPLSANPLIHQQEVPSSYSSVSGKEQKEDQMERHSDFSVPAAHEAMNHLHAPIPTGRGMTFPYGNHDSMSNLADKPLEFTSRFKHDQSSVPQSGYAYHNSSLPVRGADAVVDTWNSSMAPNVPYSSVPPHFQSVPQHDPSLHVQASVSGHSAPSFPRFAGPNFQPTVPSPGGPFVSGAGPPAGFSVDAYTLPGISERPKKAPVPNWLREEIIKTKASITSSSAGHPNYEAQSGEDEVADKSFEKGDQEDSKSIESPRSTEEEDDEDYVEAAKTAAVNQEIKRILTEVLLKVTDELFDEIATKVLKEDDAAADGHKVSPSSQAVLTPKASEKGSISVENKEQTKENASQKSSSSSAGNILGLANYASDDDNDDEEIHTSKQSDSIKQTNRDKSGDEKRPSALHNAGENGSSEVKVEEHDTAQANLDIYAQRTSFSVPRNNDSTSNSKTEEPYHLNSPKGLSAAEFGKVNHKRIGPDGVDASRLKEATGLRQNLHDGDDDVRKSSTYSSRDTESMKMSVRKDGIKTSGVESSKEPQIAKVKEDVKLDENPKSKDDRNVRKYKTEKYDSKDTKKDRDKVKDGDKIEESERRKRSNHSDAREDHKGRDRSYKENVGDDRCRERKDKEEDKHRHKSSRDVSKHKRRRSSSTSSRGRSSKDNDVSRAKISSDDASDDSRRKESARKRNLSRSPSPVKSRRRQVSRSPPHRKHSQRRHSPYSSLESSRGKRRSRSRSPGRRRER